MSTRDSIDAKATAFLAKTGIALNRRVRDLSKGMVTQLHLAVVMAIDARLLILDEPTLGLDLLSRKEFYDSLLTDYLERSRTVIVATHQVEEVQHILTDLVFIDRGRIVFNRRMDDVEAAYREVLVHPDAMATARALNPIYERQAVGRSVLLFECVDQQQLAALGEVRTPSVADLFVAIMSGRRHQPQGAAQ